MNGTVAYFPNCADFLIFRIRAHRFDSFEEVDVVAPNGVRVHVHTNLLQGEVVSLGHLLPSQTENLQYLRPNSFTRNLAPYFTYLYVGKVLFVSLTYVRYNFQRSMFNTFIRHL